MRENNKITNKTIQLPFKVKKSVLAFGAQAKNTVCLLKGNTAYISNTHDNLSDPQDFPFFEKDVKRFLKMHPQIIACDLHPEYQSTKYTASLGTVPFKGVKAFPGDSPYLVSVQHHHAHIAACMAENGLKNQKVIGVAFDGTGLGVDNTLWGAEFLIADYKDFTRAAYLAPVRLLGGEMAIHEPWRLAAFWLDRAYGKEFLKLKINFIKKIDKDKWNILKKMDVLDLNTPEASSMGRLFDAVASLVLAKPKAKFEAELAIELERIASAFSFQLSAFSFTINKKDGGYVVNPLKMFEQIVESLIKKAPKEQIAYRFHLTIAKMIKDTCLILRRKSKINTLAFSGGVFQNKLLLTQSLDLLYREKFNILLHKELPPNDACISLGQAVIAGFK